MSSSAAPLCATAVKLSRCIQKPQWSLQSSPHKYIKKFPKLCLHLRRSCSSGLLTCSLSNYGSTATELANKKVTATERAEREQPACLSQPACTASPAQPSQRAPEKQLSEYPRQQHRQPASYLKVVGSEIWKMYKKRKEKKRNGAA